MGEEFVRLGGALVLPSTLLINAQGSNGNSTKYLPGTELAKPSYGSIPTEATSLIMTRCGNCGHSRPSTGPQSNVRQRTLKATVQSPFQKPQSLLTTQPSNRWGYVRVEDPIL
ncbi:hypothetical protein PAXRUDRAFT_830523 [Paxillus rubicundulus Ve08.2h10]|uniref:Uncharacterized protein n=1 Tax=Paxillus rubicundulus Ve08.2h10 TaxID=930991 RepID=A0A0D0DTD5_9AGAM|nr:hypothetical protein PAXRUDRAFT_830523 [Paxillus rubicundulus Ve08.2h10]